MATDTFKTTLGRFQVASGEVARKNIVNLVAEGTLKPGMGFMKGTADHQGKPATEATHLLGGIALEDIRESTAIDTAYTAGKPFRGLLLGSGVRAFIFILTNIATIAKYQKLTISATAGWFNAHKDDFAIDVAGADTVTKATFTGDHDFASYIKAMASLTKDAADTKLIEALI